ncbi:hypothetical protein THAOC_18360, partial [Thalassiosira oceanica]
KARSSEDRAAAGFAIGITITVSSLGACGNLRAVLTWIGRPGRSPVAAALDGVWIRADLEPAAIGPTASRGPSTSPGRHCCLNRRSENPENRHRAAESPEEPAARGGPSIEDQRPAIRAPPATSNGGSDP